MKIKKIVEKLFQKKNYSKMIRKCVWKKKMINKWYRQLKNDNLITLIH